jgi:hypothetical protein
VVHTTRKGTEKTVRLANNKLIEDAENLLVDQRHRQKKVREEQTDKALNIR